MFCSRWVLSPASVSLLVHVHRCASFGCPELHNSMMCSGRTPCWLASDSWLQKPSSHARICSAGVESTVAPGSHCPFSHDCRRCCHVAASRPHWGQGWCSSRLAGQLGRGWGQGPAGVICPDQEHLSGTTACSPSFLVGLMQPPSQQGGLQRCRHELLPAGRGRLRSSRPLRPGYAAAAASDAPLSSPGWCEHRGRSVGR